MKINTSHLKNAGIYVLTNTINNKQYVGLDSNIPRRFKQHIKGISKSGLLHEALSAIGLENWTVRFIPYPGISRKALRSVEQWYIAKLQTKYPDGYNMRGGSNPSLKARSPRSMSSGEVALRAQVRERRKTGVLLRNLATEFDVPIQTVCGWCRDIDPKANLRSQVRERRKTGEVLETIAAEFGLAYGTVADWCKGIEVLSPTETEVIGLLNDGQLWKTADIEKSSQFTRQAVTIALNRLLKRGLIAKIKRGLYQKSDV